MEDLKMQEVNLEEINTLEDTATPSWGVICGAGCTGGAICFG